MRNFKSLEAIKLPDFIRRIGRITLFIIIIFFSFLFLPWQQTVTGDGEVRAYAPQNRAYTITAPIDGVIDRFFVKDFDYVKKVRSFLLCEIFPKSIKSIYKIF